MQTLKKYFFGKQKAKVNTYIGGIGGTINTPDLLASKLGISVNRIKLFKVTGIDVECAIVGSGKFTFNFNERVTPIGLKYYYDYDGYINDIENSGLGGGINFFRGYFPGIINISGTEVFQDKPIGYEIEMPNCLSLPDNFTGNYSGVTGKILVVPKCTSFGTTKLNNNVFTTGGGAQGLKVYAPISEQTSNSGGLEGDLAYVQSVGSSVVFVSNLSKPNAINNLSAGTIYNTSIQLNFTPPSSINGIEFYEVYLNNQTKSYINIKSNGQFIIGLTPGTNYSITIVAVDIFYNRSVVSNVVNVSTTNRNATDANAINYINASANTLYQDIIDDAFISLKSNNLYNKIQAFYLFLGTVQGQHKWNAKNPQDTNEAFRLVFSGGGTYSNLGYQCNGTDAYANTNFVPSINTSVANSGITIVSGTNNVPVTTNTLDFGAEQTTPFPGFELALKRGASKNDIVGYIGTTVTSPTSGSITLNKTDIKGITTVVSTSLSLRKLFNNGFFLLQDTKTTTSQLPTIPAYIGCLNNQGSPFGYSNQRIQFVAIHEGLTDAEVQTLHTIIDTFETAVGRKTW